MHSIRVPNLSSDEGMKGGRHHPPPPLRSLNSGQFSSSARLIKSNCLTTKCGQGCILQSWCFSQFEEHCTPIIYSEQWNPSLGKPPCSWILNFIIASTMLKEERRALHKNVRLAYPHLQTVTVQSEQEVRCSIWMQDCQKDFLKSGK